MVRDKQDPDHMPFKITGRRRGSESSLYVPKRRRCLAGEKKKVFAMKVIRKSEMIRNSQEGHVKAERDFLVGSQASRWAVPLIASFQDNDNLYLIMDYMVGGDFLGLLIRKNILSEEWTKFYLAEMVVCIEEAHRLRWIHRDVKPDNFLIDASGHLRISDFGLAFNGHWAHDQTYYNTHRYSMAAKLGIPIEGDIVDMDEAAKFPTQGQDVEQFKPEQRIDRPTWGQKLGRRKFAKSVVGTSQYMAPEVIRGEHYDGRCDWWSIGIILYEVRNSSQEWSARKCLMHPEQCLYGFTPFACEDRHDTKIKILVSRHFLRFHVPGLG